MIGAMVRNATILMLLCASAATAQTPAVDCGTMGTAEMWVNSNAALDENSGLALSQVHAGVVYGHNDDVGDNRVFAIDIATGGIIATLNFGTSPTAKDPEDIAVGVGPIPGERYIYWGDTGDNAPNDRDDFWIKRVPEPNSLASSTIDVSGDVKLIEYHFPSSSPFQDPSECTSGSSSNGCKDVEAMAVDTNGDLYLITKRNITTNSVWRIAAGAGTNGAVDLEFITTFEMPSGSRWVTGADISSNGKWIAMATDAAGDPRKLLFWYREDGESVGDAIASDISIQYDDAPGTTQPESVALDRDGFGAYTLAEHYNNIPREFYRHERKDLCVGYDTKGAFEEYGYVRAYGMANACDREVEFTITDCEGGSRTVNQTVTFSPSGAGLFTVGVSPEEDWIYSIEGHATGALAAIEFDDDWIAKPVLFMYVGDLFNCDGDYGDELEKDGVIDQLDYEYLNTQLEEHSGLYELDCTLACGGNTLGGNYVYGDSLDVVELNVGEESDDVDGCE